METRFSLTAADYVDLHLNAFTWIEHWRRYFIRIGFPLVACLPLFVAWDAYGRSDWFVMVTCLVGAAVVFVMGLFFSRTLLRLSFMIHVALNFDYKLCKNLRVLVTPDSITVKHVDSESVTRWKGIEHIAITSKHVFLYLSKRRAYVVPARAFKTAEDFQEFTDQVRRYHEMATIPLALEEDGGREEKGERS
jgi:hypothetical protein